MKLVLPWLRELVDLDAPVEEIAETLDMRGFEVASIEETMEGVAVIDVEITANRPDCLSVMGLAREVATAYNAPLGHLGPLAAPPLETVALRHVDSDQVGVALEDPALCPRYAAAIADVEIGPSPSWLAGRLHAAGLRPINNVVDVTNYVMLEVGHPMHAFDVNRLAGPELRIHTAGFGRQHRSGDYRGIRTLDGEMRRLADDVLVIADAGRPVAIAGVMGGADSEVSARTRTIAIESACFEPTSIRRSSRSLGLQTEASYRFERGADISAPVLALERACALLERIGAGRARGTVIDRYPSAAVPRRVVLREHRIRELLGAPVPSQEVTRVLEGLGFSIRSVGIRDRPAGQSEQWEIEIPTARMDVTREADLIEEVGRHHGYDRLPSSFPALKAVAPSPDPRIERARLLGRVMTGAGFSEATTFGFIEKDAALLFTDESELVAILNPLSEKFAVMRPSLLPGLIDSVAHNWRRGRKDVRLFEIGSRFVMSDAELRTIAFAWSGLAVPEHWSGSPRAVDFFDARGMVERIAQALGLAADRLSLGAGDRPFLVPGRSAAVRYGDGAQNADVELGIVGQLTPAIAERRGLPSAEPVYVGEIDIDRIAAFEARRGGIRVEPLPRYPSVVRDLSVVIDGTLPAAAVRGTIRAVAPPTLVAVREFARYQGKGIPEGSVSLSFRLTFQSRERTLTDVEVQEAFDLLVARLTEAHGARLR
ncbi:MAG: phenylalanine--tRNA ligase subunit beta [Acidobacteria bacterium]|nr:phenylalanine--tRNA ligase subunit beta [Acidobacteriota bacterium]